MFNPSRAKPMTAATIADKLLSNCPREGAALIASAFTLAYAFGPDVQSGFISGFACGLGMIGMVLATLAIIYKFRSN